MAARKTSTAPTRIWKFAARVADEAVVTEILRTANHYYNELIAIERARHERYQAIRWQYAPELAALEDEWERLDEQIEATIREVKRARQEQWRESGEPRRVMPVGLDAQIASMKSEQKRVAAAAKEHRAAFTALLEPGRAERKRRANERAEGSTAPRIRERVNREVLTEMLADDAWAGAWAAIARSDDEAHAASLRARAECGLSTGTYLQIEEAVQRAKKDSAPRPPRFRAYRGEGKLAVQLRAKETYGEALAGMTALAISPAPHDPSKKGDQSRMVVVHLDQSIPRGERRKLAMTAKLHRRPPEDAVLKWAALLVRRIGRRSVYELQLTMEHPSFADPKRPAGARAAEHISIGWARVDGGVRVARWVDGDVVVPDSILAQHDHASAIESASDRYFERVKRMLKLWMRGGPHHLTAWHRILSDRARGQLRHACIEYARWALGADRLATLWRAWVDERKSRGEDLYAPACVARRWLRDAGIDDQDAHAGWLLYTWARKDEHLCQYAIDSRRRFTARRDAFFRAEAIRISTEFEGVTVDSYKIAALKELPSLTMPGDGSRDQAQHNAQAAAPGRFREILLEVMGPRCTPSERSGDARKAGGARKRKGEAGRDDAHADGELPGAAAE